MVLPGPILELGEVGAQLRGLFVGVIEDAIEPAVGVDQLGGGLLADARHPGQVVALVTAQRCVLDVHVGANPCALLDAGLVVEGVVADATLVVEHAHVRVRHQLIAVAVAGDDDHIVAAFDERVDARGDQVVGLPSGEFDRGDAERIEHLAHKPHLLAEDVGCGLALRLVLGFGLVAERRLGAIEGDEDAVGFLILDDVGEHRGEPEDRVGDLPAGGRHVGGQGEEGPVRQRVAVDEEVRAHGLSPRPGAATRRESGRRHRASSCARSSRCAE